MMHDETIPEKTEEEEEEEEKENMEEEEEKEEERVCIIFDWDDTLMASSHLREKLKQSTDTMDEEHLNMDELENWVYRILMEALRCTSLVYIITNASPDWVTSSATLYLPKVVTLFPWIKIVSAKHLAEDLHPSDPFMWKRIAFQQLSMEKHMISIGDSQFERRAIQEICEKTPSTYCKTVKFKELPSMSQLLQQLELIHSHMAFIIGHPGHLDLHLIQDT